MNSNDNVKKNNKKYFVRPRQIGEARQPLDHHDNEYLVAFSAARCQCNQDHDETKCGGFRYQVVWDSWPV